MNRPLVIAHRGSSAQHPDNSWAAFKTALAEGADAIECDVQATRDGELVIRHDLHVDGLLTAELSFGELKAIEPGTVLLSELLDWASRAAIDLLVEIKDPDTAERVAGLVAEAAQGKRFVIGGFHGPALARAKIAAPGLKTSLMIGTVLETRELIALARAYCTDGVHPCWESRAPWPHRLLDSTQVAELHAAGLDVTLWHEEREAELMRLIGLGVDAICTNAPGHLRRMIDRGLG